MLEEFVLDPAQLLTLAGNALFVLALVKFLIKPLLLRKHGLDIDPNPLPAVIATYNLQMNLAAVGAGILFALVAQVLLRGPAGIGLLGAVLVGLAGGFSAIGAHQLISHMQEFGARTGK